MTAPRLILLLLLILVAVVIVVVVLRRGSAQRDAHRVEAAHLRSQAETLAASVAGQSAFADQAAERAEVARVEAEERAREAARLEAEAAAHRATLEATQRDYQATMRRADDIDPDVKESAYPPISKSGGGRAAHSATQPDAGPDDRGDLADEHADDAEHADHGEGDTPLTRAERREARESSAADGGAGWAAPAAASSAPAAGAVGAAAAGASAWAAPGDDDRAEHSGAESERIASAAGFRDDVSAEPSEVYPAPGRGSEADMSDNSSTETRHHPGNDDGLDTGGATAGEGGRPEGDPAEMTVIGEPEAYATTEPVMASEQTAPVSPEPVGSTDERDDIAADGDHAPAEVGAAVAETSETGETDGSAGDLAEGSTQERYDPTPTRDWAADEGDLLEQNSDRGDRLEAERADLAHQAGDSTPTTASDAGTAASGDDTASDPESGSGASASRRISAFEEIRDGGFGVGSAAPLEGGAQPLDHPVQGYGDMTYRAPGDHGYDSAEPDVWFYDEGAAQRSGFRRADG